VNRLLKGSNRGAPLFEPNGFADRLAGNSCIGINRDKGLWPPERLEVMVNYNAAFWVYWRRRRDSNPRDPCESNGFQGG